MNVKKVSVHVEDEEDNLIIIDYTDNGVEFSGDERHTHYAIREDLVDAVQKFVRAMYDKHIGNKIPKIVDASKYQNPQFWDKVADMSRSVGIPVRFYWHDHETGEDTIIADSTLESAVEHPRHYNKVPGIEAIEVVQWFNFNLGNAMKYIWRCEFKGNYIEDLEKAIEYLRFEIKRYQEEQNVE